MRKRGTYVGNRCDRGVNVGTAHYSNIYCYARILESKEFKYLYTQSALNGTLCVLIYGVGIINTALCGVEPQLIKLEFIIYLPKLKVILELNQILQKITF